MHALMTSLTPLQSALIEAYQRDLPLVARPFAAMGEALGAGEDEVLAAAGAC